MKKLPGKIAATLIVFIAGGVFLPTLEGHAHAGEVLAPAAWRIENPGPYVVDVTLAVDEEWMEAFGPDSERRAGRVLAIAAANLRPGGLNLRLSQITTWTSDDDASTIHPLLRVIGDKFPLDRSALTIRLTAGSYVGPVDGLAHAGYPYLVIRHHPGSLERDAYVLTHEIGHVFGLDHHACEDILCFMTDHGYDPDEHWCDDHLELLRKNAGYFRYAYDADVQT